jgi:phosphatidylglycerophosphate synthase
MDKESKTIPTILTLFFFCLAVICLIFGIITGHQEWWWLMSVAFFFSFICLLPISKAARKLSLTLLQIIQIPFAK